jgi:hypothetical protein
VAAPRRKASNDFTGRQAAELAAEAAEEQKQKAEQMAMMTATKEREFEDSVFDVTAQPQAPTVIDEVVEVGVELADNTIVIRVAEDIENMTYGYGNTYSFKAGGKYKVPVGVADRLQSLGLLYERL